MHGVALIGSEFGITGVGVHAMRSDLRLDDDPLNGRSGRDLS
jgi:hypothetical protein